MINNFIVKLFNIPRLAKQLIVLSIDLLFCVITIYLAFYLRLGEFIPLKGTQLYAIYISIIIALPTFLIIGLYKEIFRFTGNKAIRSILKAILFYSIIYIGFVSLKGIDNVPRTIGIIQPLLLFSVMCTSRLATNLWYKYYDNTKFDKSNFSIVLVYGAGKAGRQIVAALSGERKIQVIGFLDDSEKLHGKTINGVVVYSPENLNNLIQRKSVSLILLAIPSIPTSRRHKLLNKLKYYPVAVRTLPSVSDVAQGRAKFNDIRDLDIHDLLGRIPVDPDLNLLKKNTYNKTVLVTGAGGSIGKEISTQVLLRNPVKLILLDHNEYGLYKTHEELLDKIKTNGSLVEILPILTSVLDRKKIAKILCTWKPDTIYHAAAYKHVPLVEHNLAVGIKNNVFGTLNLAQIAVDCGTSNFVLISTDKAVRPTNIMGASKRMSELILQSLAKLKSHSTTFSMVRFGNVLESSGSVVPKFRQQINDGGPITLTHLEITRYFMTIEEASQLVIQAGAMAMGGEVFVLDMGKPIKVYGLAKLMIELSGLSLKNNDNPNGDIEIEVTGLRPGEKLYEELLIGGNPIKTKHPRILKAHEDYISWDKLTLELNHLNVAVQENDIVRIINIIEKIVDGYSKNNNLADYLFLGSQVNN